MWDIIDNLFGPLNYFDRITGWLQIATRRGSHRRHRYSRTETIRVKIPYSDRNPNVASPQAIRAHMRKYHVGLYGFTHDANHWYASVPKRQYRWFLWLYNDGRLRAPATSWKTAG